jgi:hypothetical protein
MSGTYPQCSPSTWVRICITALVNKMELSTRKLDIRVRRAVILLALVVALACWANELVGWGVFSGVERKATVLSFLALAAALYLFRVTPDETRAYRAAKRRAK